MCCSNIEFLNIQEITPSIMLCFDEPFNLQLDLSHMFFAQSDVCKYILPLFLHVLVCKNTFEVKSHNFVILSTFDTNVLRRFNNQTRVLSLFIFEIKRNYFSKQSRSLLYVVKYQFYFLNDCYATSSVVKVN